MGAFLCSIKEISLGASYGEGEGHMQICVCVCVCVVVSTFRADISTGDAHLDTALLHLHLVAGARPHTGAVVHHKVVWGHAGEQ